MPKQKSGLTIEPNVGEEQRILVPKIRTRLRTRLGMASEGSEVSGV
jgi:hypothetical protein